MLTVTIIKWLFVIAAIGFTFWLFVGEQQKIQQIRRAGVSKEILDEFSKQSRNWLQLIFFIFVAIIIWMMSYDFAVEDVTVENKKIKQELQKVSSDYANLEDNRKRLLYAQSKQADFASEIQAHYINVFTNYFLMRECKIAGNDDIFIINSAMMREILLNNASNSLRKKIIDGAKTAYKKQYPNFDCGSLYGRKNEIIRDYQSYIITTREVLKSTF